MNFLSATREQVRTLGALCLFLVVLFFSPYLRSIGQSLVRRTTVSSGELRADVPRTWMIRRLTNEVEAWKPCITILCFSARASIRIRARADSELDEQTWLNSAKTVLNRDGYSDLEELVVSTRAGKTICIQPRAGPGLPDKHFAACFNSEFGITSTMSGPGNDWEALFKVLDSTHLDAGRRN